MKKRDMNNGIYFQIKVKLFFFIYFLLENEERDNIKTKFFRIKF